MSLKRHRLEDINDFWDDIEQETDRNGDLAGFTDYNGIYGCPTTNLETEIDLDAQIEDNERHDPETIFLDESTRFGNEVYYDFEQEETEEDKVCFGMVRQCF